MDRFADLKSFISGIFGEGTLTFDILKNVISGAVGGFIVYRLAFRRFREERVWEQKRDAYTRLLEALRNSQKFSYDQIEAYRNDIVVSDGDDKVLQKIAKENEEEILRVGTIGKLFLSSRALELLKRYEWDSKHIQAESFAEELVKDYDLINTFIDDLVLIAKEDLGVKLKG